MIATSHSIFHLVRILSRSSTYILLNMRFSFPLIYSVTALLSAGSYAVPSPYSYPIEPVQCTDSNAAVRKEWYVHITPMHSYYVYFESSVREERHIFVIFCVPHDT